MPHCRCTVPRSLTRTALLAMLVGLASIALAPVSGAKTFKTVANFTGSNGGLPIAGLTDIDGTLYGTTSGGGKAKAGTLFSYDPSSGHLETRVSFNGSNGKSPNGLTNVNGTLYGTTAKGGKANDGTLFSYDLSRGRLKTLASFTGSNGKHPLASLTDVRGTLYGTTAAGGKANGGVIFVYQLTASSTGGS